MPLRRGYRVPPGHDARLPHRSTARHSRPAPPSERGAWLLAAPLGLLGVGVLVGGAHRRRSAAPAAPRAAASGGCGRRRRSRRPAPASAPRGGRAARARADRGRGAIVARPSSASRAARRLALRRSDADAHRDALDGRLLSDLRDRPEHVRGQLAAARLDPPAGVGLLDRAQHLPRPELRRLLRRADAVQRHQRAGHHLAAGQRLLPLRQAPGGV